MLAFVASLATSSLVAFATLSANLSARFGPIDDGEALRWLNADGRLQLGQYWSTLAQTEVGTFGGDIGRFRPFYYLVRVGQAAAFGDDPQGWYWTVIVVFVAAIAVWGSVFGIWLGIGARALPGRYTAYVAVVGGAVAGVLVTASLPFWTGVATRLGPQEGLGLLMVGLMAFAATLLMNGGTAWWWLLLGFSTAAATTTKENFLPLVLVPFAVALYRFRTTRVSWEWGAAALSAVPGLITAAVVISIGLRSSGVYYGDQTLLQRTVQGVVNLVTIYPLYWFPAALAMLVALLVFTLLVRGTSSRRLAPALWMLFFVLGAWLFYDASVYGGIYSVPRYAAVLEFVKVPLMFGALAIGLAALGLSWILKRRSHFIAAIFALFLALSLIAASLLRVAPNLNALKSAAETNAAMTNTFESELGQVLSASRSLPVDSSVVLVVQDTAFLETAHRILDAVAREGGTNPTVLIAADPRVPVDMQERIAEGHLAFAEPYSMGEGEPAFCVFINSPIALVLNCSPGSSLGVEGWSM